MPRAIIAIVIILAIASRGSADPATANRAAAEADARAAAKDYLGAAAKFREAYAADPRPDFICNVGVAYYKAQELTRAQLFLGRCLERGSSLDGKFMDVVRATLAKIEGTLRTGSYTPVEIIVEPRFATVAISSFAAGETFDGDRTVWLPFGSYRVTVTAEGYTASVIEVTAKDTAILPIRITLVKQPVIVPDRGAVHEALHRVAPTPAGPSRVPAIATSIAAAGLAGFAVYALVVAHDHADRAGLALRDDAYRNEADAARRWNTIFGIDVAVTGVVAAASGYLWYRVTKHSGTSAIDVSARGATITVGGRF